MRMDERKRKILEAIILDYISSAEPVGSRVIAKKYGLGVSPATIRNEMADLEEQGYIEQPHTSAGRIPSDLGYRYYVDSLMERRKLGQIEMDSIRRSYDNRVKEVAQVIHNTSQILSQSTNYTSIVLGPQFGRSAFKHIQLVHVDVGIALVVVVSENGFVQNKTIDIPENIRPEDLNVISQVLNDRLKGLTLNEIKKTLMREIYF
jgi:heat-inducible transcriptional repressor